MDNKNFEEDIESELNSDINNSALSHNSGQVSKPKVNRVSEEIGVRTLNKLGVPKPIAKQVIKKNGGAFSPTNLPANKILNRTNNTELQNRIARSNHIYNQNVSNYNKISEEQSKDQNEDSIKGSSNSIGMPSFLKNNLLKKQKKDNEEMSGSVSGSIDIPVAPIAYGLAAVILIIIVVVVCIVGFTSEDDVSELNTKPEVIGYVKGNATTSEFTDTLVYLNLCRSNENTVLEEQECLNSNPGKFFTHLKQLYNDYQKYTDINGNSVLLDVSLILETISYSRTDSELFDDKTFDTIISEMDALAAAQIENYQEVGDLYYEDKYLVRENNKWITKKRCLSKKDQIVYSETDLESYYRISDDKYISYLKYGQVHENYNGEIKIYDVDIHPDSDSSCIPSGRMYQSSDVVRYVGH